MVGFLLIASQGAARGEAALHAAGIDTVAVIISPVERASLYFRYRPTPVMLLSDPDCLTHQAFGVPRAEFLPEGSTERPSWPYHSSMAEFEAARINPTGELPEAVNPMSANPALNAKDGFAMTEADDAMLASHPTQLAGHFLIDAQGIVSWVQIEAVDGPNGISLFPTAADIIAATGGLRH